MSDPFGVIKPALIAGVVGLSVQLLLVAFRPEIVSFLRELQ